MKNTINKNVFLLGFLMIIIVAVAGCESMQQLTDIGATIGTSAGLVDSRQADSIRKTSKAVARTFQDITPEQEYYIGRTVGAVILDSYKPYDNERANQYINKIGQTLALASDLPETFGGYHFLILDSDEINAFAAPGGLIFVTRGMLRCCKSEDAVAAVLAHEIAHVQFKHGLKAIKKSRITDMLMIIGAESAKSFGGQELSQLTSIFEDSIGDITQTLVNNGYSRAFEREADTAAITILHRVGYGSKALEEMLAVMSQRLTSNSGGFAKTHPSPQDRIEDIHKKKLVTTSVQPPRDRQKRFVAILGKI